MVENQPPGFRFYPTEQELVSFYLRNKLQGHREDLNRLVDRIIPVVNIYDYNPWDLPQFSLRLCHRDPEQWFFFIPRQENEARGGRPNRLTTEGYWKATGSPGYVYSSNGPIGEKRTMVFYRGRAPNGSKTEWKMNEYKAIEGEASTSGSGTTPTVKQEFSVCRIYKKTKCLRAFDRRPPPGLIINEPRTQQARHGGDDNQVATSSHQNVRMVVAERTSSAESSSSGDHDGRSFLGGESSNMVAMASNNEPWWDWEEFDRFFGIK